MTAHGVNPGVLGSLRLGERSAALSPSTSLTGESTRLDHGAGGDGTLSPNSLTEHIQFALTTSSAAASPRECDCPDHVLRCLHKDGCALLVMVGPSVHDQHGAPLLTRVREQASYLVADPSLLEPCRCGAEWTGIMHYEPRAYFGTSEADALAAFFEAEQALLRGGEA